MTDAMLVQGERMHVPERLVVAPAAGVFRWLAPEARPDDAEHVVAGQSIGVIEGAGASTPVKTRFAGCVMGRLAETGQRLRAGQPVAWLRIG